MRIRRLVPVLIVLSASGISPALADCCSDFFGCAAAVVTAGLSCEVQEIVSTVQKLATAVKNLINETDGATQQAESNARQYVSSTIQTMQSQAQLGEADLAAAQNQANQIFEQEKNYRLYAKTDLTNDSALVKANGQGGTSTPSQYATTVAPNNQLQKPAARAPQTAPVQRLRNAPPAGSGSGNSLQATNLAAGVQASALVPLAQPPGTFVDLLSRGAKQVASLKGSGDQDLSKVSGYLTSAAQSEGPGVQSAEQLAGSVINAPLKALDSWLSSLLSNPAAIFDPSAAVDQAENNIVNNLTSNLQTMIDDITTGPQQNFDAAKPSYEALLGNADAAQAIVEAMNNLYKQRTTAAQDALAALLPKVDYAGLTQKSNSVMTLNQPSTRLGYAQLIGQFKANKQKSMLAVAPKVQQFQSAMAQLKVLRGKGRTAQSPALVQGYQNSVTQKFNGYFLGKSPAAVASERDQLVAEARNRFAGDPKTQSAVINLINNEAAKRGGAALASVPAAPQAFGQSKLAPVNPATPATPVAGQQTGAKPPVAWGAATAWKPPTATGVQAGAMAVQPFKVAPALRPAGQQQMQAPAPSTQTQPPSSLNP